MINDAEKYRDDDDRTRERVNARNHLETYLYSCKQAVENYNGSALTDSEKASVINACEEMQRWLDRNILADKTEIDHQYADLERKCQRIMTKMHNGGAGGQQQQHNRSQAGVNGQAGPRVEEVD